MKYLSLLLTATILWTALRCAMSQSVHSTSGKTPQADRPCWEHSCSPTPRSDLRIERLRDWSSRGTSVFSIRNYSDLRLCSGICMGMTIGEGILSRGRVHESSGPLQSLFRSSALSEKSALKISARMKRNSERSRAFRKLYAWITDEFKINVSTSVLNYSPLSVIFDDNSYAVFWSYNDDGRKIRGQLFDENWNKVGSEFEVISTAKDIFLNSMKVAVLTGGSYVVCWSTLDYKIYARMFDKSTSRGSEFQVNYWNYDAYYPEILALDNEMFVITWNYKVNNIVYIYARLFSNDGYFIGYEFAPVENTGGVQVWPRVARLTNGNIVFTWHTTGELDSYEIFSKIFDNEWNTVQSDFKVNARNTHDQQFPRVAALKEGGFVVAWNNDGQDGSDMGVFAQVFDSSGNKIGGEIQVNQRTQDGQHVGNAIALNDGGFLIVFDDYSDSDGDGSGVFARRFDQNGNPTTNGFQINQYTSGDQESSMLTATEYGFIVTWQGLYSHIFYADILVRVYYDSNPSFPPSLRNPLQDLNLYQFQPVSFIAPEKTFYNPSGNLLTFSAHALVIGEEVSMDSFWLTFDPQSRTFAGTPTQQQTVLAELKATEANGSASDYFQITVEANSKPVINALIPNQVIPFSRQTTWQFYLPKNTFKDLEGDSIVFTSAVAVIKGEEKDLNSEWETLDFDTGLGKLHGTPSLVGEFTIRIYADDGLGDPLPTPLDITIEITTQGIQLVELYRIDQTGSKGFISSDDSFFWISEDSDLKRFDLSSENPLLITGPSLSYSLSSSITALLAISGDRMLTGDDQGNITLLSSSTNSVISEISVDGQVTDIYNDDEDLIYVSHGSSLSVIQLTAESLEPNRTISLSKSVTSIAKTAEIVYAGTQDGLLFIDTFIDTSNDLNIPSLGYIRDLQIFETYLYVLGEYELSILDASDPHAIQLVSTRSLGGLGNSLAVMKIDNEVIVIVSEGENGVNLINASDPLNLSSEGSYSSISSVNTVYTSSTGRWGVVLKESEVFTVEIFRRDIELEVCDTESNSDPCSHELEIQAQKDIFKDFTLSEYLPTFKTDFLYGLSYSYRVQEVSGSVYSSAPEWLFSFKVHNKLFRLSGQVPEELIGSVIHLEVEAFAFERDGPELLKWKKLISLSIVPKHASLYSFIPDQHMQIGEEWVFSFDESVFSDADNFECEYLIGSEWTKSYDISFISFTPSSREWNVSFLDSSKENFLGCNPCDDSENSTTYLFKVIAKNSASDSDPGVSTTFELYIHSGVIPDQQIYHGTTQTFTIDNTLFHWTNNNLLSFVSTDGFLRDLPGWISYKSNEKELTMSPTASEVNQDFDFQLYIYSNGVESWHFLTIRVRNQPPVAMQQLQKQNVKLGQTLDYSFSTDVFSDSNGDSLSYTVQWQKQDGALKADIPSWITFTESTLSFYGYPSLQEPYRLLVSASDGLGGQASTELMIEVYNNAPLLNLYASFQSLIDHHIGLLLSLTLPYDLFTDADGDTLSYSALQSDGSQLPSWLTFIPSSIFLFGTPSDPSLIGTSLEIEIEVSDGYSSSSVFLKISITNASPQPSALEDQTVHIGDSFNLSLSSLLFSDSDGDVLTYSALLQDGSPLPSWLIFNSLTFTIYGTPDSSDLENTTINIRISASDGYSSAYIDFSLSVENNPPSLTYPLNSQISQSLGLGFIKFKPGVPFEYALFGDTFTDSDNDVLTFSSRLSNGDPLPQWLSFDAFDRKFFGTPTIEETLSLSVTAFDGYASASDTFEMKIVNQPPTLNNPLQNQVDALYPDPLGEGLSFSFLFSEDTFTDQDDPLSYSALFSENGGEWRSLDFSWIDLEGRTLLGTVSTTSASNTTLSVQITASDGQKSVSDTLSLTILTPFPSLSANSIHIDSMKSSIEVEVFTNGPKIAVFSYGTLSVLDISNNLKTNWRIEGSPSDVNYVLERVKYRPSSDRLLSEFKVSLRMSGLEQEYPLSIFASQEPIVSSPIPDQKAYIDNTFTLGIMEYFNYAEQSKLTFDFEIEQKPERSTDWLKFETSGLLGTPTNPEEIGSYKLRMTVTDEFDEFVSESFDLEVDYTLFQQFISVITTASQVIGPIITILGLIVYRAAIWNLYISKRRVHAPFMLTDTQDNIRELLILRPDEEKVALKIFKQLKYETIPKQEQLICDMESQIKDLNTKKPRGTQRVHPDIYEVSISPSTETLEHRLQDEDAPLVEIKGAKYHARFLFFCLKDNVYKQTLSKSQLKEVDNLVKDFKQRKVKEDRLKEMPQYECMKASEWAKCKDLWTIDMPDLTKELNSVSDEILDFFEESGSDFDLEMFMNRMRIEQWRDRAVRIEDNSLLNDLQLHKEILVCWKIPWKILIKEWIHRKWISMYVSYNALTMQFDTSVIQILDKLYVVLLDKKGYLVFKMIILPKIKPSNTVIEEKSLQIEDRTLLKNGSMEIVMS